MSAPVGARQVTVAAERLRRWLDGFAERHGTVHADFPAPTGRPAGPPAGTDTVHLEGADGAQAWIEVPFPPLVGATLDALVDHVELPRRIGVLLVRRAGYAAGLFAGAQLLTSKVGSTYVQGTTKAGGWSQQRYARRRANQADAAFADAADAAARILGGSALDALVAGGDRDAVRSVLADKRLSHLTPTGPWLQVKDPKLRILEATPAQFRAVRVSLDP